MTTNILEYLEESSQKYPNKKAFVDERETYTYQELKNYGESIGSAIGRLGVLRRPVVVYLDKSVKMIASFMGILYSGNFYCPIDVNS